MVSASGCGPEGRRFESGLPPHSQIRRRRAYGAASFFVLENKFSHKKNAVPRFASGGMQPPAHLLGFGCGCRALLDACASCAAQARLNHRAFAALRLGALRRVAQCVPRPFDRGIEWLPSLRLGEKRCLPSLCSGSQSRLPALRLGRRSTVRRSAFDRFVPQVLQVLQVLQKALALIDRRQWFAVVAEPQTGISATAAQAPPHTPALHCSLICVIGDRPEQTDTVFIVFVVFIDLRRLFSLAPLSPLFPAPSE